MTYDIEIEFELTLLTYKVFSCKDVRSKFLGVRLLPAQHTWTIFDVWSAIFKQGGILRICIDNNPLFYSNG